MMADLRNTTNEFKSTWEREVDFEEETKALQLDSIDEEATLPVPRENSISPITDAPEIRTIDKESFDKAAAQAARPEPDLVPVPEDDEDLPDMLSDKRTWL